MRDGAGLRPGVGAGGRTELAPDVAGGVTGRRDVGVGREPEAAGVDEGPPLGGLARALLDGVGSSGQLGAHLLERLVGGAGTLPEGVQRGQVPRAGGAQRDAPAAGAPQLAAHEQQPGREHGRGVGPLGVLEEGRVDRAGAVVEGQEHHPPPRPDRRRLGRDLHPGHEQLGPAAPAEQVAAAGHLERIEERGVGRDRVLADVEAQDLQLGAHPLPRGHLRQPGRPLPRPARLVAELQRELDRLGLDHRPRRPRLRGGTRPDAGLGQRVPLRRP